MREVDRGVGKEGEGVIEREGVWWCVKDNFLIWWLEGINIVLWWKDEYYIACHKGDQNPEPKSRPPQYSSIQTIFLLLLLLLIFFFRQKYSQQQFFHDDYSSLRNRLPVSCSWILTTVFVKKNGSDMYGTLRRWGGGDIRPSAFYYPSSSSASSNPSSLTLKPLVRSYIFKKLLESWAYAEWLSW